VSGQNVYVVGSIAALGSWNTGAAVPLSSSTYPVWHATVSLPANTPFEYKYIVKDGSGAVTWEPAGNHSASTGSGAGVLNDSWGGTSGVTVDFSEYKTTVLGQNVYVAGSIPALGGWDPNAAVALSSAGYPYWKSAISIPANTSFTYKYLVKDGAGNVTWESGANRSSATGATGTVELNDTWK
jgi:alpha-amylase